MKDAKARKGKMYSKSVQNLLAKAKNSKHQEAPSLARVAHKLAKILDFNITCNVAVLS